MNIQTLTQIAIALSGQWTAEMDKVDGPEYHSASSSGELIRADGLTIRVSSGGWAHKDKNHFAFSRPRNAKGEYPTLWEDRNQLPDPSINTSDSKSPDKIAKDIVSRLLPDAEKVFALANERIASDNAYASNKLNALRAVCATLGKEDIPTDHYSKEPRYEVTIGGFDESSKGYGKVRVNSAESIDIELSSVPPATAHKILTFLREMGYWTTG